MPLPALPAASATPVLARTIRLVASVVLTLGVSVAVQVIPPSLLLNPLSEPLATVRSARVKPVTASLKVMVTRDVPPIFNVGLATTMVAVGSKVSMT